MPIEKGLTCPKEGCGGTLSSSQIHKTPTSILRKKYCKGCRTPYYTIETFADADVIANFDMVARQAEDAAAAFQRAAKAMRNLASR